MKIAKTGTLTQKGAVGKLTKRGTVTETARGYRNDRDHRVV